VTEFNDLSKLLNISDFTTEKIEPKKIEEVQSQIMPDSNLVHEPFNIDKFTQEIYDKSINRNQLYREHVQNISAYDLASGCIKEIVYKLNNTPVESFADKWLPIMMRSTIGSAIHNFIQSNSKQFTETEVSLKVPSLRLSVRLDNLIGQNILVEIKSCTYSDYEKIITSRKPRISDFYQTIAYKYLLENHLKEAKDPKIKIREGTSKPYYDSYKINTIQFIYVAHDMIATDVDSFGEILNRIKEIKRMLHSKSNSFFFITTLAVDVTNNIADPYINFIKSKIEKINYYLDNNLMPPNDDPFIDKKKCFFCMYKQLCDVK